MTKLQTLTEAHEFLRVFYEKAGNRPLVVIKNEDGYQIYPKVKFGVAIQEIFLLANMGYQSARIRGTDKFTSPILVDFTNSFNLQVSEEEEE